MSKIVKCPICGSESYVVDKNTNECVCSCCGESFKLNDNKTTNQPDVVINEKPSKRKKFFNNIMGKVIDIHSYFNNTIMAGTAFFVNEEYALTNAHVVYSDISSGDAFSNMAIQINGSNYEKDKQFVFDIVNADFKNDIALLKLQEGHVKDYASFANEAFNGETVYAIGNSRGEGLCVLDGIISDSKRVVNGQDVLMTSALVTNGNSGGPVYNENGQIVGMVAMSSDKSIAMNYAIPSSTLINFIKDTEDKEEITIL